MAIKFLNNLETSTGSLTITKATTAPLLYLYNTTNAAGATIRFSDQTTPSQVGDITFYHSDGQSQGGGASWHFSSQPDTVLVVGNSTTNGRFVSKSAGSLGEVDYGFYDDVNTGMVRTSADNVSLVAGGVRGVALGTTAVSIRYAGSTKLQTSSGGVDVIGNGNFSGDITVSGGDITLGGTGRIQGVDTVSANTDAANKLYVDNAVSGVPIGNYLPLSAGSSYPLTGALYLGNVGGDQKIQFQRTGGNVYSIEHDSAQLYFYNRTTTESPLIIQNDGDVLMNAGNVGIGTTSPDRRLVLDGTLGTAALEIKKETDRLVYLGTGSSAAGEDNTIMLLYHDDAVKVNISTISDSYFNGGNVGIGTTSPSAKLQVGGGTSNQQSEVASLSGSYQGLLSVLSLVNQTANLVDDGGVALDFHLNSAYSPTGRIATRTENASDPTDSYMQFFTYESGLNERMRITSSGNVGIGTTNPTEALMVEGWIRVANNTGIKFNTSASSGDPTLNIDSSAHWNFLNTAGNNLLKIDNGGNVGIGTTSPGSFYPGSNNLVVGSGIGDKAITVYAGDTSTAYYLFAKGTTGADRYHGQVRYNFNADTMEFTAGGSTSSKFTIKSTGVLQVPSLGQGFLQTDSSGNISTSGGGTLPGGPYLPLSAGDSYPLTGNLVIEGNAKVLRLKRDANQSWIQYVGSNDDFVIRDETDGRSAFIAEGGGNVYFPGGNVGIGTTSPGAKLQVYSTATRDVFISGYGTQAQNTWQAEHAFFVSAGQGVIVGKANAGNDTNRQHILYSTHNGDAEYLGYDTNNATKVRLNTNGDSYLNGGNVGIGTTNPSEKLEVDGNVQIGSTTDAKLYMVSTGGNGNNERFFIEGYADGGTYGGGFKLSTRNDSNIFNTAVTVNRNGNVGIGTNSPGAKLHVGSRGTAAAPVAPYNDGLMFDFANDSYPYLRHSSIISQSSDYTEAVIDFYTKAQGASGSFSSATKKMTIRGDGNVGIGTDSPFGTYTNRTCLSVNGTSSTSLNIGTAGVQRAYLFSEGTFARLATIGSIPLQLGVNDSSKMIIDTNGNVGIGTTSPSAKLHVVSGEGVPYSIRLNSDATGTWQIGVGSTGYYDGSFLLQDASVGDRLRINSQGTFTLPAYDSTNNTGTPTYILGTDASGNVVKTQQVPGVSAAASLYELIPNGAFTTTYSFTSVAGVYSEVMEGNDVITSSGTYSVQIYVHDYAAGGTQYQEFYSGVMTWSITGTNDAGGGAVSEIALHRAGHAGNSGMIYLRTRETNNTETNKLKLEVMCNKTYTSASNLVFKFVRLI